MTEQVNKSCAIADVSEPSGDTQYAVDQSYTSATDRAISVRYLLSEIPLFIDTAGIVGSRSSVFCYHRSYEFYERFFNNEFMIGPAKNQAFLVVTFDEELVDRRESTPTDQACPVS